MPIIVTILCRLFALEMAKKLPCCDIFSMSELSQVPRAHHVAYKLSS